MPKFKTISLDTFHMIICGIESTAHTFGVGIFDGKKILANAKDVYVPERGKGIHPGEAAEHHRKAAKEVMEKALKESKLSLKEMDYIAYSKGPGLPPCLKWLGMLLRLLIWYFLKILQRPYKKEVLQQTGNCSI